MTAPSGACRVGSVWRHRGAGRDPRRESADRLYVVQGTTELQVNFGAPGFDLDGEILVLYREVDGLRRFARELDDFERRFEEAPTAPCTGCQHPSIWVGRDPEDTHIWIAHCLRCDILSQGGDPVDAVASLGEAIAVVREDERCSRT